MSRETKMTSAWVMAAWALSCLSGCGLSRELVPSELLLSAQVPGIPNARITGARSLRTMFQDTVAESIRQAGERFKAPDGTRRWPVLAISGGGASGAFGAGLLNGWSAAGDRPTFKAVTGISTGALAATLAFLGKDYDDGLKEAFTTVSTSDILEFRSVFSWFTADSLGDSKGLAKIIARHHTKKTLEAVAREHARGRRLFIGTTNLDADRIVIWNMGVIASSTHPDALNLYRKVVLASASIPIVFPPVYIKVTADGMLYKEMHGDGGLKVQVFTGGILVDKAEIKRRAGLDPTSRIQGSLYVIRNGKLHQPSLIVRPRLADIADRTITSLVNSCAMGDLYRICYAAGRYGSEFNLAIIPDEYEFKESEAFDPKEMTRLYNMAFEAARKGYPWRKVPPGMTEKSPAGQTSNSLRPPH